MSRQHLINRWYSKTRKPIFFLVPLGYGYQAVTTIRRWLYRYHILPTHHVHVPVIVVGNLTVGGTGKTPLVAWLAEWLKSQGYTPGIVSRGYGGCSKNWPQPVTHESDPHLVGDEAVMLTQQTQCPMWVGPNRVAAARALLGDMDTTISPATINQTLKKPHCDIIISDDGLQHFALGRDLEIIVTDGVRGFGNGHCLPAGPLRESLTRLSQVDLLVSTGQVRPGYHLLQLSSHPIYNLLEPNQLLSENDLQQKKIHAVAGIGHPERFFTQLEGQGLQFIRHIFPDHHFFCAADFKFLKKDDLVIMTEKDAVKCKLFAESNFWCLPVKAKMPDEFINTLKVLISKIK